MIEIMRNTFSIFKCRKVSYPPDSLGWFSLILHKIRNLLDARTCAQVDDLSCKHRLAQCNLNSMPMGNVDYADRLHSNGFPRTFFDCDDKKSLVKNKTVAFNPVSQAVTYITHQHDRIGHEHPETIAQPIEQLGAKHHNRNHSTDSICILGSNITEWSTHAQSWILSAKQFSRFPIMCLQEHHLKSSQMEVVKKLCNTNKIQFHGNEAKQSDKSIIGSNGGECILAASQLYLVPIPDSIMDSARSISPQPLAFAVAELRLAHVSLLLVSLYLATGEGLSQCNIVRIQQLTFVLKHYGIPFIISVDANMTADIFKQLNWLDSMNATILEPDIDTTASGSSVRIDWWIVSKAVLAFVIPPKIVSDSPW